MFGREDRRTTGSRGLPNEPCRTWAEFYGTQRLVPLARLAHDVLPPATVAALEALALRLDDFAAADEQPARLHGDLWAGNRLIDAAGDSWLIDPAAHGGHREFDLAMMRLFGGFGAECFAAYDEVYPLADGWSERVALHQIAPLVVHAVKFGGGYVGAATRAIHTVRLRRGVRRLRGSAGVLECSQSAGRPWRESEALVHSGRPVTSRPNHCGATKASAASTLGNSTSTR